MPRLKSPRGRKPAVQIPTTTTTDKPTTPKRGRGRPRKSTPTSTTAKSTATRTTKRKTLSACTVTPTPIPSKVVKDESPAASEEAMDIDSQAVRWKVVKFAWRFTSDTEVAKLLLDCYDVIVSGCLKWGIDIKKTRIPSMVSDDGWNLLEEIASEMKRKASQPMKKRMLTKWPQGGRRDEIRIKREPSDNDDSDDYGLAINDDSNDEDYVPESDDHDDEGGRQNKAERGEAGAKLKLVKNADGEVVPVKITKAKGKTVKRKRKIAGTSAENSGPKRTKKSQYYRPKGYSKSGRPRKILELLKVPDVRKLYECKKCKDRHDTLEDFKEHYKVHEEMITVGNSVQHVSHMSVEAIPEIAIVHIQCPDCNELTSNYGLHQLKHFKQMCDLCGKVFKSFSGWRRHQKLEKAMETGEKNHICDKCGKGFILVSALTEHRRLHSKERPHKCGLCGKGFKQKAHMKRHMFIHSDVKPITCKYCGKGFTNNFNLKSHLRSHTGERPYTCQYCQKSFAHNGSLKTHLKTEHNIQVELACPTVQEFDGFAIPPKMTPGRKKSKPPEGGGDDMKRDGPQQDSDSQESTVYYILASSNDEAQDRERQVRDTFNALADGVERQRNKEDVQMETSGNEQQQVMRTLETVRDGRVTEEEEAAAILSIAAASSGISSWQDLRDENTAGGASELKQQAVLHHHSANNPPPTSHQETYAQNVTDSVTVVSSPNVVVQSTPSTSSDNERCKVEASRTNPQSNFGVVHETRVPMVSREEEVGGLMSRLPIQADGRHVSSLHAQQMINIQVPRVTVAGQSLQGVHIPMPPITSEQQRNHASDTARREQYM